MSEISDAPEGDAPRQRLAALQHRFIDSWGELALIWGTQRSGGRLHSLLYISPEPMCAEEIGESLQISHGNTSTTVRQLLSAGVIRRVHRAGERRAYFTSEPDPWQWMRNTIRIRRDREVMPVLAAMRSLLDDAEALEREAPRDLSAEVRMMRDKILVFYTFLEQLLALIDAFITEPQPASTLSRRS
jgi:DNA-binding transcriptional regulator GbsR (MarR family)